MIARRAARALLVLVIAVSPLALPTIRPGLAQSKTVQLTLLRQTPWTSTRSPNLKVAVLAMNNGRARLGDLSMTVTFGNAFTTRSEYETALIEGPANDVSTTAPEPFRKKLDPGAGEAEPFTVSFDVSSIPEIAASSVTSVYPMRIDLRSGGAPVGTLNTSLINLYIEQPPSPLRLAWWTELPAPIAFDPSGSMADPAFEASLQPEGSLGAQVAAVQRLGKGRGPHAPIDLVMDPALLDQLNRMTGGYRRAADGTEVPAGEDGAAAATEILGHLRAATATDDVQVTAMPFASPSIPAMLASDLVSELQHQQTTGDRVMKATLGVAPGTSVARAPGDVLDDATLSWFVQLNNGGPPAVLGDVGDAERQEQPNGFAPAPTATIAASSGRTPPLVMPDPSVQALMNRPDLLVDPVRAAQAILGELAMLWREEPAPPPQPDGSPTVRGVAMSLPSTLPPTLWSKLLPRVAGAPFLQPEHAQDFVQDVNAPGPPAEPVALSAPDVASYAPDYANEIRTLGHDIDAYASMLTAASAVPERLRRDLAYATAAAFVADPAAGASWFEPPSETTSHAFGAVQPTGNQSFTFTSSEGSIPLRMGDPGPIPLAMTVWLQSPQFTFPDGDRQDVVLQRPDQIVTFRAIAKAAGKNSIVVSVLSPSERIIGEQTITVRSTAVNTIALMVTAAAGGGLLLLYVRRRSRRRTSST
jgi:hypothetical protein